MHSLTDSIVVRRFTPWSVGLRGRSVCKGGTEDSFAFIIVGAWDIRSRCPVEACLGPVGRSLRYRH